MTLISFHTKTNFSNSITIKLGKIAYHGEEDLGGTGNKGKVDGALPLYTYTHTQPEVGNNTVHKFSLCELLTWHCFLEYVIGFSAFWSTNSPRKEQYLIRGCTPQPNKGPSTW